MKKKKQQKSVSEVDAGQDLESMIHENTLFFDKLIELIPAKFYLSTDDKEKPWFQGLSKAAKAQAKRETKENIKKSRRERLDPDKPHATTLDLLKQSIGKEKADSDDDEDQGERKPIIVEGDDRSVTYEELRQRLHHKLEEFRSSRNCGSSERAKKREERNVRRGYGDKKRKRDNEKEEKKPAPKEDGERVKKDAAEASKELVFGHVKLSNEEMEGKKKRKVSKHKELERAKKLEEAKKDPEKGEALAKKESWRAAMDRASGIKVHDNPKLLEKSIRKEKKKQQKNTEKWKERIQTRDQLKAEKQQKRSENISERIHQKKIRRIAKREKKLMRPGFEGRKEGFMNEGSG